MPRQDANDYFCADYPIKHMATNDLWFCPNCGEYLENHPVDLCPKCGWKHSRSVGHTTPPGGNVASGHRRFGNANVFRFGTMIGGSTPSPLFGGGGGDHATRWANRLSLGPLKDKGDCHQTTLPCFDSRACRAPYRLLMTVGFKRVRFGL